MVYEEQETGFINFADGRAIVWAYTSHGGFRYVTCSDAIHGKDDPLYQQAIASLEVPR